METKMNKNRPSVVCLDVEGVLTPEIWIAFSEKTGIEELRMTTRQIPVYDDLMKMRIDILKRENLKLKDIQSVIKGIKPLPGAVEFLNKLRSYTQVILLSDTFMEFAAPLMEQLNWPTLFCNSLVVDDKDTITSWRLRCIDGKREAVASFRKIGFQTSAAGDSYNDITMLREADKGALFHAPQSIIDECNDLPAFQTYKELLDFLEIPENR